MTKKHPQNNQRTRTAATARQARARTEAVAEVREVKRIVEATLTQAAVVLAADHHFEADDLKSLAEKTAARLGPLFDEIAAKYRVQ